MSRKYKYFLAIDPSGNYNEGKGTTGWVIMDCKENLINRGSLSAKYYRCAESYWHDHITLIRDFVAAYPEDSLVIIEDYVLYRDRSANQTNSQMETCRLIGLLLWYCWRKKEHYTLQSASSVVNRWNDDLLLRERIISRHTDNKLYHKTSGLSVDLIHTRDAMRHALHYIITRNETRKPTPTCNNKIKPRDNYKRRNTNYWMQHQEDDFEDEPRRQGR